MHAGTNSLSQGKGRQTDGAAALRGCIHRAVYEIFKKSPNGADLQPRGRDLAQQRFQITGIPLLTRYSTTGKALWGAATYCGGVHENPYYATI